MKIFWSWQNDTDPKRHRHFIKGAIDDAIAAVALELDVDPAERPEIDHDVKGSKGAVEIANTIMGKIASSTIFVADVTPIARAENGKALPNPNVMVELGWAFNKPGFARHIYVMNTADGFRADDLPFDIRHRLVMTYQLAEGMEKKVKEGVKKTLVKELTYAIRTNLEDHLDEKAAQTEITRVAANPADPSIWASAGETISHYDTFDANNQTHVKLVQGPRAYIRVTPAGWRKALPTVNEIERYENDFAVRAPAEGTACGDFGPTEEGFVRYWFTGKEETKNVAMFFDETGEFWVLHGTAFVDHGTSTSLAVGSVLKNWSSTLHRANFLFDRLGASPVRRVEVGLVGLKDSRWPGRFSVEQRLARKDRFMVDAVDRDWSADRQRDFLIDAYTLLTDIFGWPKPSCEEAGNIVDSNDVDRHLLPPWLA